MNSLYLNLLADHMANTAFSVEPEHEGISRQEEVAEVSEVVGRIVLDNWAGNFNDWPTVLRSATFLACRPSFECVARSEPHSLEVADQVTNNFQMLSEMILDSKPGLYHPRQTKKQGWAAGGRISEAGILGLMWWGIANGRESEKKYALPATTIQDNAPLVGGKKAATDIHIRESGVKKSRVHVQVKSSIASSVLEDLIDSYDQDMVIISAQRIGGEYARSGTRAILEALTGKNQLILMAMHKKLQKEFDIAAAKAAGYNTYIQSEELKEAV
jgi:hypothetical protein